MAENIREEIRRLNRRKQLSFGNSHAVEQMQDSESSGSEMGAESPRRPDTPPAKNPEMALFTFKQVCFRQKTPMIHFIDIFLFASTPEGSNDL